MVKQPEPTRNTRKNPPTTEHSARALPCVVSIHNLTNWKKYDNSEKRGTEKKSCHKKFCLRRQETLYATHQKTRLPSFVPNNKPHSITSPRWHLKSMRCLSTKMIWRLTRLLRATPLCSVQTTPIPRENEAVLICQLRPKTACLGEFDVSGCNLAYLWHI